jgi:hypothetical protein
LFEADRFGPHAHDARGALGPFLDGHAAQSRTNESGEQADVCVIIRARY